MSMATNRAAAAAQSNNIPLGITLMVITTFVFAVQDGLSRHLASEYNVMMVVMIRYWFFAAFVIALAKRHAGGLRAAARTSQPVLQIFRGLLLAAEICVMIVAFTILGLVESHAVFTCYPLLVAALSGPVLGESVGWRRWAAIGIGFIGVLIILQPGMSVFDPAAVIPLVAAAMAYIGFAADQPTTFDVMFRPELVHHDDERLVEARLALWEHGRRVVEQTHQMQQRALAGTGSPQDGQ